MDTCDIAVKRNPRLRRDARSTRAPIELIGHGVGYRSSSRNALLSGRLCSAPYTRGRARSVSVNSGSWPKVWRILARSAA